MSHASTHQRINAFSEIVRLENVAKSYLTRAGSPAAGGQVKALNGISLQIARGEFVVVSGPSGSGKTTLLMILAGMLRPTSGVVSVQQRDLYAMNVQDRAKFRAKNIGFVFQMFHLIPYLNVHENIALAGGAIENFKFQIPNLKLAKQTRARELIKRFGLADRTYHKPAELSAGEKQRTAIARALLNHPRIILADEPTGNLDADNAASVLSYIDDFHRQGGTVILATHGPAAEKFADRVIHLRNGKLAP